MNSRAFARAADSMLDGDGDIHSISQIENPALQDTDSKDSQLLLKDDVSKVRFMNFCMAWLDNNEHVIYHGKVLAYFTKIVLELWENVMFLTGIGVVL